LQVLLYQQIFVISFYVYGIWGNIALQEILSDLSLPALLSSKLTVFIPVLGIPFLAVSWFMLLRFSFELNGIKVIKIFPFIFFPVLFIFVLLFAVLVDKEIVNIDEGPDRFIIRSIALLNLIIHFIFLVPFLNKNEYQAFNKGNQVCEKTCFNLYGRSTLVFGCIVLFQLLGNVFSLHFNYSVVCSQYYNSRNYQV
jgi:hypothetical protein